MLKIKNRDLREYYLKKFVQHLVYSSDIREDLEKYDKSGIFSNDEFFEVFESEIKLQAYYQIIDEQTRNNILRIVSIIKKQKTTDISKLSILEEIIEEVLTQNGKNSIEHYRFELKCRLGKNSYVNKATDMDIKRLTPDIRKSMANDFVVLEGLLLENIEINNTNIHFVLDSLNVIRLEYPEIFKELKKYIQKILINYKNLVDIHIPRGIMQEADMSLGLETLHDMDYSRTRSTELIKKINKM